MYVILGSTGHVGSALTRSLLSRGESVTVVVRDRAKARAHEALGARVVIADVHDVEALRKAYMHGERLFMLNPPAAPSTDTQTEERKTVANMLEALRGSGIKKVVGQSAIGAQPGELLGDLNVLYEMEQGLKRSGVPYSILRGAYYMSNWDAAIEAVRKDGVLQSFLPADRKIPMVAPRDLGETAAELITAPIDESKYVLVEGPERYTSAQVGAAFAAALGRDVKVETLPKEELKAGFKRLGFSDRGAESYANMTRTLYEQDFPPVGSTVHGATSLESYVEQLVNKGRAAGGIE